AALLPQISYIGNQTQPRVYAYANEYVTADRNPKHRCTQGCFEASRNARVWMTLNNISKLVVLIRDAKKYGSLMSIHERLTPKTNDLTNHILQPFPLAPTSQTQKNK
ncbi:unnamed protein product, partial [Ectocarpus sp. 4 AP-2014]